MGLVAAHWRSCLKPFLFYAVAFGNVVYYFPLDVFGDQQHRIDWRVMPIIFYCPSMIFWVFPIRLQIFNKPSKPTIRPMQVDLALGRHHLIKICKYGNGMGWIGL